MRTAMGKAVFGVGILIMLTHLAHADDALQRIPLALESGDQEAWAATVSLPIPREQARNLWGDGKLPNVTVDGAAAALNPVGWWERDRIPRRVIAYVSGTKAVGATPSLDVTPGGAPVEGASPWELKLRPFKTHHWLKYKVVLRGGSHEESESEYDEIALSYKGRSVALRFGSRREMFHDSAGGNKQHDWWQWATPETLLDTPGLKLVRVGGLLYNEDTFEHCDIYLELFGNGVARVSAHFVNARVIGDGWEYYGIPVIGLGTADSARLETDLDGTKTRFDLGGAKLDITDSADLVSAKFPGRLYQLDDLTIYQPWKDQRVTDFAQTNRKATVVDVGEGKIPRGMARTVRFTLSLSEAPPKVAHLLAPPWLYAMSEELWNGNFLPAQWRYAQTVHGLSAAIAKPDERVAGTFEAGYSGAASEGMGGSAMLYGAMFTGDPALLRPGLAYTYNWADIQVDHVDFSVRQPFTGYYWKTIPYVKFDDMIWGYLETGDPYLIETAEHCGNGYYAMFRSLWPVRSVGRGTWPVLGLVDLYRFTRKQYYLDCALELMKKTEVTYQDPEHLPGHQMGVGPNGIGNTTELAIQGFAQLILAHTAIEVALEGAPNALPAKDREGMLTFASRVLDIIAKQVPPLEAKDTQWRDYNAGIYMLVLMPLAAELGRPELITKELESHLSVVDGFLKGESSGRPYFSIVSRALYDSGTIRARWANDGLTIDARFLPQAGKGATAKVWTPRGVVELTIGPDGAKGMTAKLADGAPVTLRVENEK